VLAGGLTPDGGLPEWVHRRMDVARDLHIMQGRRPPIICSGVLTVSVLSLFRLRMLSQHSHLL
jgi:hypothetical protein